MNRKALNSAFLALASAWALSGCAGVIETGDALAVAPYKVEGGERIVIDVFVDDQGPYKFLFDTGASISVVFDRLRYKLGLESIPGSDVIVHGIVSSGEFPLLKINQLQIGSEVWNKPRIVALPDETAASKNIDGVLGVDFLRHYSIGFSTRERVIRLYHPDSVAERRYRGWSAVPLREQALRQGAITAYFVDIEVGGEELPAVFDLGAGLNVINIPGAHSLNLVQRRPRTEDEVTGLLRSLPAAARFVAPEVKTGRVKWRNEVFLVADLEIFKTLMLGDSPLAILGVGFFTQRDFVIDFARNRLLIDVTMDEVETPETEMTPSPRLGPGPAIS